jgi:hypothetical protein
LSPRSTPCVFIGYSSIYKGYKCLDLNTNRIYISRHVIFDESSFPFKDLQPPPSVSLASDSTYPLQLLSFDPLPTASMSTEDSTSFSEPTTLSSQHVASNSLVNLPPVPSITQVYTRRRPTTISSLPPTTPATHSQPVFSHTMITRAKSKSNLSLPKALLATNHPISHQELDPTTYVQASKEPHWRGAMAKELDALAQNNTWSLVPASQATNIIGCK